MPSRLAPCSTKRTYRTFSARIIPNNAQRIFLLSPANIGGIRGSQLMSGLMQSDLAGRLRNEGAPLGEIFSFISRLYFRGKLAYSQKFAKVTDGLRPASVIMASAGLIPCETLVTLERLREICAGEVDITNERYRGPLDRDANALSVQVGTDCEIVLLGSIATPKYAQPLLGAFGERLLFPAEFVGRGDMSRVGLMLRCVSSGVELAYIPLAGATRHGARPPKLGRAPKKSVAEPPSRNPACARSSQGAAFCKSRSHREAEDDVAWRKLYLPSSFVFGHLGGSLYPAAAVPEISISLAHENQACRCVIGTDTPKAYE
jgi:hypothetical protein